MTLVSGIPKEFLVLKFTVTSNRDPGINSKFSLLILILVNKLLVSALILLETESIFPL